MSWCLTLFASNFKGRLEKLPMNHTITPSCVVAYPILSPSSLTRRKWDYDGVALLKEEYSESGTRIKG